MFLQAARLSYVILNYDKLGFDAADFRANSRSGRCQVSVFYIRNRRSQSFCASSHSTQTLMTHTQPAEA
ncbi:unnamed protein product [Strongylus vulgaris]|uniref:Uncharacterized protein n=1 Tax=Strongylus vulgaris TaxID=40348 RepID=A0A3P7M2H7_STRVU|nr:unnamed protein product [Strongylus vulgaris]